MSEESCSSLDRAVSCPEGCHLCRQRIKLSRSLLGRVLRCRILFPECDAVTRAGTKKSAIPARILKHPVNDNTCQELRTRGLVDRLCL